MNTKKPHTINHLRWLASHCSNKLALAMFFAVLSVGCGMVPYFMVADIALYTLRGGETLGHLIVSIGIMLLGYTGKILFHNLSTNLSHQAAYTILKKIRQTLVHKLYRLPLGDVMDRPAGEYKTIIVDTVERIEQPLAHIIPELFSNLLVSLLMFLYIGVLDYRIALLSLGTMPLNLFFYRLLMKKYVQYYKQYTVANNHMNAMIVAYINGIETIKAFNQSEISYGKYSEAVEANKESKIIF